MTLATIRNARRLVVVFLCPLSVLVAMAACLSCSGNGDNDADAGSSSALCAGWPEPGVAFPTNFTGFHSWQSKPAYGPDGSTDGLHGVGPLTVYWNASPPHGATEFPECTIIVKESQQADVTKRVTFAMVKVGNGYNSTGANGWEWWSLQDNDDGGVEMLWSGIVPPPGETYSNQAIGDCNGCHSLAVKNDYVWDTALQLSNF
jgi:hypothetical protein